MAEQFANAELFGGIVFDDQQALATRAGVLLDASQGRFETLGGRGFGDERECAARQTVMPVFVEREHLHGNVPGGRDPASR